MVITSKNNNKKYGPYNSTQLRFALTSTIVTGLVLLFLNIYCAHFSQQLFYQSKQLAMVDKAMLAAEEMGNADVLTSQTAAEIVNRLGGPGATRLIVTDTAGRVLYDSTGTAPEASYALFPQIVSALRGNDIFTWHYDQGVIRSETAIPIVSYNTISGCLYMMDHDPDSGRFIQTLLSGILLISVLLELFLLLFSLTSARRFSSRLRSIMASMRIIQDGNYTHKVSLEGNDELTFLGEEFNDLTERLQRSEDKRRQFVSDASHELKTPLASIKLLTDSILQYDMDAETTREFVTDIGNEADRLNRMTLKLLSLTKGEQESQDVDAEIIYMEPTIRRAVKMLSSIALESNIQIHLQLEDDSAVMVQEDDLYQIAYNLIENGIKYNVPNGKLTVCLSHEEDFGILQVIDTGMGIPPESVDQIFERFYRVDKARSRQTGGSGLGLAIVRSMVERNGGEISLESVVGQGSTFTVVFPRFDLEQEDQP